MKIGRSVAITRRQFFSGMLGAGALAAGASVALPGCQKKDSTTELIEAVATHAPNARVYYLDVSKDQIVASADAAEAEAGDYLRERASFDLPLGCLLYQNSEDFALVVRSRAGMSDVEETGGAASASGGAGSGSGGSGGSDANAGGRDSASGSDGGSNSSFGSEASSGTGGSSGSSPLVSLSLLNLQDGSLSSLLDNALGAAEDFVIYDARANNEILIWVECHLTSGEWRVHAAPLLAGKRGTAALLDEGGLLYEPPMLCVCAQSAYWTVMPNPDGSASFEDSLLKRARLTGTGADASVGEPEQVYVSHGRMITNPQSSDGVLTFVPRVDVSAVFYQLTALHDDTGEIDEVAILPPALRVSDAVFGPSGFSFQIELGYDYAKGLSRYGTYEQMPDGRYFFANKTPSSPTASVGGCLYLKSTKNIIGFDVANNRFFVVGTPKDCVEYGDILAGSGAHQTLVTYTTITNKISADKSTTRVRVLEPVTL
ncbi:MAG: hypothetical protein LBP28_07830 [Coriobacteriales bacterium]|jgi:hypothetical protein|nr:hypothetical protein [Coriobacteriales bacterium]